MGENNHVTVSEQTLRHMWHRCVKFVIKVCMTTITFPKRSFAKKNIPLQLFWHRNISSEQKIVIFRTNQSITYQLWNKTCAGDSGIFLLRYGNQSHHACHSRVKSLPSSSNSRSTLIHINKICKQSDENEGCLRTLYHLYGIRHLGMGQTSPTVLKKTTLLQKRSN